MKKILLSIMLSINVFSINLFYGNNVESVNEIRIINEYDASLINSQNDDYLINDDYVVTIRHNNEFVQENEYFDSHHDIGGNCYKNPDEELIELREKMEDYYSNENRKIIDKLNIDAPKITYSLFAPFIQIIYDDYSSYLNSNFDVFNLADENLVNTIYLNNGIDAIDNASSRNSDYIGSYDFEKALNDVGIDSTKYNGDGIRIGIIESGSPIDLYGLNSEQINVWDGEKNKTAHSVVVGNIIAGNNGISKNSELYYAPMGLNANANFYDALNWQLSYPQSVHLINMSWGTQYGGLYTSTSELLDYLTINSKVVFVVASSNYKDTVNSYSTGFNTICVGSTDVDGNISFFSNAGVSGNLVGRTNKPTVVAPGGRLYNLGEIPNNYLNYSMSNRNDGHSGTSFATPIVTGICALLIDEYEYLMLQPWTLHSIIISGTNFVNGQTTEYDNLSGYGMINYNLCRQIAYDNNFINVLASNTSTCYYSSLTVPSGSTINMTGVMFMPGDKDAKFGSSQTPNIEQTYFKISLVKNNSERTVLVSSQNNNTTNYFNLIYFNNSSSSIDCLLKVEVVGEFNNSSIIYGAFSYYGEGIHTHWYRKFPSSGITSTMHTGYCNCGDSKKSVHVADSSYVDPLGNGRYVPCYYCNYAIDTWNTIVPGIPPKSVEESELQ